VHYSLSILYAVFAVFNWFAPFVVFQLGPKWSLFVGASTYWWVFINNRKFIFVTICKLMAETFLCYNLKCEVVLPAIFFTFI